METAAQQPLLTESNAPVAEPATTQAAPPVAVGGPAGRAAERDDYVRLLWSRIMRFRPERVPFAGTARLHFTLGADGSLQAVEISASSGSGLLDRIALDAVKRASPFPLPPADLPMDMLTFEIPFQFR
ncbi:MAG: cell envelope integrity protein TolA [Magnetospirillum sp.]|nr:cell envelope integrity protein TolA [Magnetospirillum sp.]